MEELQRKKRPLTCKTPGCGHQLELHVVEPTVRCRVTGCTCDKWRAQPDPVDVGRKPVDISGSLPDIQKMLDKGQLVVIGLSTWSVDAVRLELVRAGLGLGESVVLHMVLDPNAPEPDDA